MDKTPLVTGSYVPRLHAFAFRTYPDGLTVRLMPSRKAMGALQWLMQPHPTHNLPLSLGPVGRW
jgi:hypothetical protein